MIILIAFIVSLIVNVIQLAMLIKWCEECKALEAQKKTIAHCRNY